MLVILIVHLIIIITATIQIATTTAATTTAATTTIILTVMRSKDNKINGVKTNKNYTNETPNGDNMLYFAQQSVCIDSV